MAHTNLVYGSEDSVHYQGFTRFDARLMYFR
jgi:hypothetical protein